MPRCTTCESAVSYDFVRAHGENGTVDWCPRCRNDR
ncbi:DUF7563 family protein [Natrinema salsiterrestre]